MRSPTRALAAFALGCGLASPALGLETDQYYSWGRPLTDSTDVVNAKFNLELERAIASFDRPPEQCMDIAIRFRKRARFVLFHPIQIWALHTSLVARIPADADDETRYRHTNLYHNHGPFDPGMWMIITPTIEINEVRIGTDKLSHFVSSGWTYYSTYRRALRKGETPRQAERAAVRRGIHEEKLILGAATSGILSLADLEANLQGMYFYLDLCEGSSPVLERGPDGWVVARPVDLRDYVHPRWDESYRSSIYHAGRWRKVRPVLEGYCDRRGSPQVLAMHERYHDLERPTLAEEMVAELVAEGRLPDPNSFSLDAVCGPPAAAPTELAPAPPAAADAGAADRERLTRLIVAHERNTERRTVGLAAVRVSYPQVLSASLGVLASRQPADYDCRTPCDFWGTFAQIEPGLGGGKLSLGWGRVIGEQRGLEPFLSSTYLALAVKASLLRTWGEASQAPAGQSYAGVELEFSVAKVNMGLGLLDRVQGEDGRRYLVSGYLGWGF